MYFEINVSHQGKHLFATAKRSISTRDQAKALWQKLKSAFPGDEGYEVTVTKWTTIGERVTGFEDEEGTVVQF